MSIHVPTASIDRRILFVRGHKVMLDSDLAGLYGVPTKRLNEQVRRNISRFPADFMFQLSPDFVFSLSRQESTATSKGRGDRRKLPNVFTEHGAKLCFPGP